ncbi:MAG: flagellar type III secretion system protein FlhB [Sphingobacteriia bacterium]|nr:flagellar type III secretion system protein FlhB [Sphingobacteriia bacterium]NCC40966.1 flagellar type III secretion system protein FlhB [Gammaproteobacteria bacterium]
MAEDSDLERTERPSPRRLEQAREEGQVPQSRELATFMVVACGAATIWLSGGWMAERLSGLLIKLFGFDRASAFDPARMLDLFREALTGALFMLLPLFGVLMVAAVVANLMVSGLIFAPKALSPKFSKLNPIKGLGRVFSLNGLAEMVKAVLKSILIGGIGAAVLWYYKDRLYALVLSPIEISLGIFATTVALSALFIALGLALLPLLDVPYQLWQYQKRLRMTREEVKREGKEQEGDPQIKARVRALQREMARRRMMAAVPKADVVVTNPTQLAVALQYDAERMGAPVVVAKGRGEVAARIREIAEAHAVPIFEAPPLARALFKHCELGAVIPAALYTAVAEVLAYVFQLDAWLRHGGLEPVRPSAASVPPALGAARGESRAARRATAHHHDPGDDGAAAAGVLAGCVLHIQHRRVAHGDPGGPLSEAAAGFFGLSQHPAGDDHAAALAERRLHPHRAAQRS